MAAGLLKSQSFRESWRMGIAGIKPFQRQKHWPCESWLIGVNMGKRFQSLRKYSQYQHESMAFNQSPSSPRCFASHWLDSQTASGTSHRVLTRDGWPDYVFAFHDHEEIGPKMLAR